MIIVRTLWASVLYNCQITHVYKSCITHVFNCNMYISSCPQGGGGLGLEQPAVRGGARKGTHVNHNNIILVWWMGLDYKLFCATLCTRSDLLGIHSLYSTQISMQNIPIYTNPWVLPGPVCTPSQKKLFQLPFLQSSTRILVFFIVSI